MIKKFKRWYGSLLSYKKIKLFSFVLATLFLVVLIILDISGYCTGFFYVRSGYNLVGLFIDTLIFLFFGSLPVFFLFYSQSVEEECTYKMQKMFEDNDKKAKQYFHTTENNIIQIVPKDLKKISDIIEYYNKRGKVIKSYWVELDEINKKPVYYISVICEGETDRIVYPKTIENFGYFLARFTFKI